MQKFFLSILQRNLIGLRHTKIKPFYLLNNIGYKTIFKLNTFYYSVDAKKEDEQIKERIVKEAAIFKSLMNEGQLYMSKGKYEDAQQVFAQALEISLRIFGEQHQVTGVSLYSLGNVFIMKGEKNKAKHLYERALYILSKQPEKNREHLLRIKKSLERTDLDPKFDNAYDLKGLKESLLKELEELKTTKDRDEIRFANIHSKLGTISLKEGNVQEATLYKETGLNILEQAFKGDPKALFYAYIDQGIFYKDTKRPKDAVVMFFRALDMISKEPSEDTETLRFIAYQNMGRTYVLMKEYGEALEYFLKAVKIKEQNIIKDEIVLSSLYHETATVYFFLRRGREALEYFNKALSIKETQDDKVGIARLCQQMAECCLFILKDFEASRKLFQRTYDLRKEIYGEDHPETKNLERVFKYIDANSKR